MRGSRVCDLLGIQYPIIQGCSGPNDIELAAAISEAGCLGELWGAKYVRMGGAESLRKAIRKMRERTDKPFSINLPWVGREQLRATSGVAEGIVEAAIAEKVKIITCSAGDPTIHAARIKSAGIILMQKTATVHHAMKALEAGVDAIISQGTESAGWQSYQEITTLCLVPQVVDAVKGKVPVIAAGGIADARGVIAAFALGAEGVLMGTRCYASAEGRVGAETEIDMVLKSRDDCTEVDGRAKGHLPRRVFTPVFVRETHPETVRDAWHPRILGAGQICGLIKEAPPCKDIISKIVGDIKAITDRVNQETKAGFGIS